jgi:VWFA-related protein
MLLRSFYALAFSVLMAAVPVFSHAQAAGGDASAQQPRPAYTFQASTRIVLTDVTVTDRNGNPIHGLKQSQFHIFDNGKPQTIDSFEEHASTPAASMLQTASASPGVFSNDFMQHLPPVLNIIVLDTTNLEIPDQMYLAYKLNRFLKAMPLDQPLAIYWRTGPASILLQGFTTDRELLQAAVKKALPHFPPMGRYYYSDVDTLYKIAFDLGQFPGRKNILWFSGGSTLYLSPDPLALNETQYDWRQIYDELETSRIAIYPIDARGLTTSESYNMWAQHALMNNIAEATGGQSFYNNNGLDQMAEHWLSTDSSFYTLTYSPTDFHADSKWHKVQVKLDNDSATYTLSYRRGYFADKNGGAFGHAPGAPRTRVLKGGETIAVPDIHSNPILFQARVLPVAVAPPPIEGPIVQAPQKRGMIPYSIHYTLPLKDFTVAQNDGKQQIMFGVAVIAMNQDGANVARLADKFVMTIDPDKLRLTPDMLIPADQQINLRKGENYLYFAVWDMTSGRLGTLQTPVEVAKIRKP